VTILCGTVVKMTFNHINNKKMVAYETMVSNDVNLNENENESWTYIIYFLKHLKINENVVVCVTWDVIHRPLDTTWHLIQFQL
jgi:hypothetical protein